MAPWTATPEGVIITVRLTPRSGVDAIDGVARLGDGSVVLKARVRAAPFEGEANAALCRLIAKTLDVAPRQAELVGGEIGRIKRVLVKGDAQALSAMLARQFKRDSQGRENIVVNAANR